MTRTKQVLLGLSLGAIIGLSLIMLYGDLPQRSRSYALPDSRQRDSITNEWAKHMTLKHGPTGDTITITANTTVKWNILKR